MALSGDTQTAPRSDPSSALWEFVGRRDTYAEQLSDGNYIRRDAPLTTDILQAHLAGSITVGSYTVQENRTCRFVVLDFDRTPPEDPAPVLRRIQQALAHLELDRQSLVFESSGRKGYHGWFFFEAPIPQEDAFNFGRLLRCLARASESFPKSARPTGKGVGNLVKLPCAVHRISGRRSFIFGPDLQSDDRPLTSIVASVPRISPTAVETILERHAPAPVDTMIVPQDVPSIDLPRRACLDRVERTGVQYGVRAHWTFFQGVDHREHGLPREEAHRRVQRWNRERNHPPLPHQKIAEQVQRAYTAVGGNGNPYTIPLCTHPLMRAKCVGQENCAWWLAQHPETADGKRTLQDFVNVGWPARFRRSPATTLAYAAITRMEQVRRFAPGSRIFASLADWAWAAGLGTRKTVRGAFQRLQKVGLVEFVPGKRGVGAATMVRRVLPMPMPE